MQAPEIQTVMPQPYEQEAQGPGIAEFLGIFKRRLPLIIAPFLIFMVIGALVAYVVPPQYTQMARFKIRDPGILQSVLSRSAQVIIPHKPQLKSMVAEIKRQRFLEPIVRKVGITEGFNLNDPYEQTEFYQRVFQNLDIARQGSDEKPGADIIDMAYTGRDPRKNVDFLNEIRESYAELFRRNYRNSALGVYEQQKGKMRDLSNQLARLEAAYEQFRTSPDFRLVGIRRAHQKELADLSIREQDLRVDINNLEAQLSKIDIQLRDQSDTTSVFNQIQNPAKVAMGQRLTALRQQLSDYINVNNFTEINPFVQAQRKKIEELEAKYDELDDSIDGGVQTQQNQVYIDLQNDKYDLQRQLQGTRNSLQLITKRMETIQNELGQEIDLTSTDDNYKQDILQLRVKERQARQSFEAIENAWDRVRGQGSDLFEILELPNSNSKPVFPNTGLFIAMGAGIGLLLGVGLAFLKEFSSMTFLTTGQVQNRMPVPLLGEVSEIKTEEERAEERRKKRKGWIFLGLSGPGLRAFALRLLRRQPGRHAADAGRRSHGCPVRRLRSVRVILRPRSAALQQHAGHAVLLPE